MANLIYKTNFEDIVKINPNTSSIPISHAFNIVGGQSFWMEGLDRQSGVTPHSGSRCVGMEVTDLTVDSPRNEFDITGLINLVGSELFVSVWLYLLADWGLFDPTQFNWYELADPTSDWNPEYPTWSIHIINPPAYNNRIDMRSSDTQWATQATSPISIPRGRWFNLKYYVKRSSGAWLPDGAVKVWIDGQVVCDLSNAVTRGNGVQHTIPAKIYGSLVQAGMPYKLWFDDLEIWNGMPPITPTAISFIFPTAYQQGATINLTLTKA